MLQEKQYCIIHMTSRTVFPLQYLSQYWKELKRISVGSYWQFIMIIQKRQFIEMLFREPG
jgi:hypothetical protein